MATYTDGQPPEGTGWFYKWLRETAVDFRVQKSLLLGLNYCVLGLGNSLYDGHFNTVSVAVGIDNFAVFPVHPLPPNSQLHITYIFHV